MKNFRQFYEKPQPAVHFAALGLLRPHHQPQTSARPPLPARMTSHALHDDREAGGDMAAAARVLNLAYLQRQCMGDTALADELLELFRTQAAHICAAMLQKCAAAGAMADHAHKLKGSAAAIGAGAVADAAERLETACRNGLAAAERDTALAALALAVKAAFAAIQTRTGRA